MAEVMAGALAASRKQPLDSAAMARLAAEACDDRRAMDIVLIRVEEVAYLTDWFVICSGGSPVQVRAIARSVEETLKEKARRRPLRLEGVSEGRWVLLDYGELIVHVMGAQERHFYDLEGFWSHGELHTHVPMVKIP